MINLGKDRESAFCEIPSVLSIREFLKNQVGEIQPEWKFYSPKFGWTLKLLHKKRNFCFISPREGYFNLSFVFGDKAVTEIQKNSLPKEIIDEVVNARKFAEGRGLRLQIRSSDQLDIIQQLLEIKSQIK